MQQAKVTATKTSQIIEDAIGADFVIAPLNRSMDWRNFKGTEAELRAYIMKKYGREVELV